MSRAAWCLAAALAACSSSSDSASRASEPPAAPEPAIAPQPARAPRSGSPHGGTIAVIAVADTGDAALTIDDLGDARVWPRLDGSTPPVPIRGVVSAVQVAIARTHDGLLAAMRDTAGDVAIVRLTAAGAELSRAQLPEGARYEQVVLASDVVLARRSDQTVGRFDARGTDRGTLAAPPGQQIAALAVRAGTAVAITGDTDRGFRTLRELDLGGAALRWGRAIELPHPATARVALSPSHHRFAMQSALDRGIEILDIAASPPTTLGAVPADSDIVPDLGFVDDDHLAIAHNRLDWWSPPAAPRGDPWAIMPPSSTTIAQNLEADVGDGVFAVGTGGSLQLVGFRTTRWLGYRVVSDSHVTTDGAGHFVMGPIDGQMLWLDSMLRQTRAYTLPSVIPNVQNAYAVDGSHVLVHHVVDNAQLELYDVERPNEPVHVKTFATLRRLEVDADQHIVVAMVSDTLAERFRIEPAAMRVTPLAPLALRAGTQRVFPVDPARADGVVALAIVALDDGDHVDEFKEAPASSAPLKPIARGARMPSFVLPDGSSYDVVGNVLEIHRGAKVDRPPVPPGVNVSGLTAVSHDAQSLLVFSDHEAFVLDAHAQIRWRAEVWQLGGAAFSTDDRVVALATLEGVIAYDTMSGKRLATACGWQFGAWSSPFPERALGVVPVCAE